MLPVYSYSYTAIQCALCAVYRQKRLKALRCLATTGYQWLQSRQPGDYCRVDRVNSGQREWTVANTSLIAVVIPFCLLETSESTSRNSLGKLIESRHTPYATQLLHHDVNLECFICF